jgi:CHAD domain-containing protein
LEGVHQVRKEIKKLRAVLRLARGKIGKNNYKENIKSLRNAANRLTALRDAHVRLGAFEKLTRHFTARPFPKIKNALLKNCRAEERKFLKGDSAGAVNLILRELKERGGGLKMESDGWAAIGPGLKKSYRRGQDSFETVRREPSPEDFHEWRKRVKDLWYHARLLCPVWPKEMRAMTDELETLGELVGDDHDLVLLGEFVAEHFGQNNETEELNGLIRSRQKQLHSAALKLGARFYSEKPDVFCRRLENYWRLWRKNNSDGRQP